MSLPERYTTLLPFTERPTGTDAEMLLFALDRARVQFAWKVDQLTGEQLRQRLLPSELTLASLLKHLAFVEDQFTAYAQQQTPGDPWTSMTWVEANRWVWSTANDDDPGDLYNLYYSAVARSQQVWPSLVASGGLDVMLSSTGTGFPDWSISRRRLMVDMLEEYQKHTGHADLIRESIDGRDGNGPEDQ